MGNREGRRRGMDGLILLAVFAGWLVLQLWVLPRLGVPT
jgi:hypothetical protein